MTLKFPRRAALTCLAGVSLVFCLGFAAAWVSSYRAGDGLFWRTTTPEPAGGTRSLEWSVWSAQGGVMVWRKVTSLAGSRPPRSAFEWDHDIMRVYPFPLPIGSADRGAIHRGVGFTVYHRRSPPEIPDGSDDEGDATRALDGTDGARTVGVVFPYWSAVVLTALPPAWWGIRFRRRRRAAYRCANGLCVRCGYDLRATPGRCPECGASA